MKNNFLLSKTLLSLQKTDLVVDADQDGWLVSYADLITLLFVLFAVLLSISSVSSAKLDFLSHEMNKKSISSLSQLQQELKIEINKQNLNSYISTEITNDGLQILFSEQVLFPSGEAVLSSEGEQVLKVFCHTLSQIKGKFHMAIEGHTDNRPIHTAIFPSNWALSAIRSVNVLHFLIENGVDENRMMVRAYANTRPLTKHSTEEAKNRRVTLLVF